MTNLNRLTLKDKDLTAFLNALRVHHFRKGLPKFKYLAGSEYGSRTQRPHYHLCIFGLVLTDLKLNGKTNSLGQPYYTSPLIDKL